MAAPLVIEGMLGMGDNIYQFPIVKHYAEHYQVTLKTPWPEVYEGLNVDFIKPTTRLRTQNKSIARNDATYKTAEPLAVKLHLTYTGWRRKGLPLYQGLLHSVNLKDIVYNLRIREAKQTRQNIAVVRPATLRSEWMASSRNPGPQYIQWAIDYLRNKGLEVFVVADIDPPAEVYDGPRPRNAHYYFEKGELSIKGMMDLVHQARVVVGGVGFLCPMAIALGTPAVIIHGGAGGLNRPELIDAPGEGVLRHVLPLKYCPCSNQNHHCNKAIPLPILKEQLDCALC